MVLRVVVVAWLLLRENVDAFVINARDAYVDWDRNGKKNDYGHNKNVGAQKGVQHCILTVAELNVVER